MDSTLDPFGDGQQALHAGQIDARAIDEPLDHLQPVQLFA